MPTTPMVITLVGLKSIIMDAGAPSVETAGAALMQMSSVGMFATIIFSLTKGYFTQSACRKYHLMPREKRCGALDSCFRLVGPHQQSIPQLLSLASPVYKGWHERSTCGSELMRFIPTRHCSGYLERSACGSELMRFIPTRLCHWYVLTLPRHSWFGA